MKNHPNKTPFIGVLTLLDTASDKPPSGGHGHRVLLTTQAAEDALDSLRGMGVSMLADGTGHDPQAKIGIIEDAEIRGNELLVTGYLFHRDCPTKVATLQASAEYGMSYELADALVEDIRAPVWKLTAVTFTGAAILLRAKAAYRRTDFVLM